MEVEFLMRANQFQNHDWFRGRKMDNRLTPRLWCEDKALYSLALEYFRVGAWFTVVAEKRQTKNGATRYYVQSIGRVEK